MFFLIGSPLEARQDKTIYLSIVIAAVIAIILFVLKKIVSTFKSDQNRALREAKKTTNLSIVNKVTKIYDLKEREHDFLYEISKKNKIPNMEYLFHSEENSNTFFNNLLTSIKNDLSLTDDQMQDKISVLFTTRQKIDNGRKLFANLTSTTAFPTGQRLQYYADNNEQYSVTVLDNIKEGLVISVPRNAFNQQVRPAELSRIKLLYQTRTGIAYEAICRIIRYQNTTGAGEIVVTHCNTLQSYQRRQFKRIDLNADCMFSAVKVITAANSKDGKIQYQPLENKYKGQIVELSAGGCSLQTSMAIRDKQYIHIALSIDGKSTDQVIGLIINTSALPESSQYMLHIVFVRISKRTRNKIFSRVYQSRD